MARHAVAGFAQLRWVSQNGRATGPRVLENRLFYHVFAAAGLFMSPVCCHLFPVGSVGTLGLWCDYHLIEFESVNAWPKCGRYESKNSGTIQS